MGTGIVWLRRDLRLRDHPALRAALDATSASCQSSASTTPAARPPRIGVPNAVLLECLAELDENFASAARAWSCATASPRANCRSWPRRPVRRAIHFTEEVSPFARERGERAQPALERGGIDEHRSSRPQRGRRLTRSGPSGQAVHRLQPFFKNWLGVTRRDVLSAPREMPALPSGSPRAACPPWTPLA